MNSSFLCENCGIKVSGAEGTECPGCGHANSQDQAPNENYASTESSPKFNNGSFARRSPNELYVVNYLLEAEAKFDEDKPRIFQREVLNEVIENTVEKIKLAPDDEAKFRLSAYLSEIYRQNESYHDSVEAGKIGINSSEQFFIFQSHNSILDSLFNLGRFQDFEAWLENALKDNFLEANYYKIKFLASLEKHDEALELCDSHYVGDSYLRNANRADILVKAKRFEEAEQTLYKLIANGPRDEHTANWINTLAFSILIPQKRYLEAERVLISAICTKNEREKINAFSNLAMLALKMDEPAAAKRFATIATNHPDNPIASESRLTLCQIEHAKLLETSDASTQEWEKLFASSKDGLERADFADVPDFLQILRDSAFKLHKEHQLSELVKSQVELLKKDAKWGQNVSVRERIRALQVEILSKEFFEAKDYQALDQMFTEILLDAPLKGFDALLEYLKMPFASIDLRLQALKIGDVEFLTAWATFESMEEILLGLTSKTEEPILIALAENEMSPEKVCELIAAKEDLDLDVALAGRSNLTDRMKSLLARSEFEPARKLIAMRNDLTEEIFKILATDSAMLVRDAIRENNSCPAELRALAALGSL